MPLCFEWMISGKWPPPSDRGPPRGPIFVCNNWVRMSAIINQILFSKKSIVSDFLQLIDCFVYCIACRSVLLESKLVRIKILQFKHDKAINNASIAFPIDFKTHKTMTFWKYNGWDVVDLGIIITPNATILFSIVPI